MKKKIQIYDRSIDRAGICKDYKDAIAEFIWNSFDADATTVEINTKANDIGGLDYLEISDNGKGIQYESIDSTFGAFLVSSKGDNPKWSNIHGNEGKGRFSFIAFANEATWETTYENNGIHMKYNITITSDNKDYIEVTEREVADHKITGTKVVFKELRDITMYDLDSYDLKKSLCNIFAWFLYLNKDKDHKILINGKRLDYSDIIDSEISQTISIEIDEYEFTVHFIKWIGKIREKYYYYFIDRNHYEKYKQYTSFNKDSIEFPHSLYIISDYFNDFTPTTSKTIDNQVSLINKNQKDIVFSKLVKQLKALVENKRKKFVKEIAPEIIRQFNKEGAFPRFKSNKYDQERKKDLEEVVTEIYSVQPRIFQKCNLEQKKSIIGFLNLLLDTDERENIISIIEDITKLTSEEREDLSNVLKKTNLQKIIKTLKMIENRFIVIGILKKLVFELSSFTNEREHIQKAIEENYWLFGEQYNLVSADVNFEQALMEYLYILDGTKDKELYRINNQDRLRRPDIFICRSRSLEFVNATQAEENIIVELKKPKVILDKEIYRQVEDYMDLIINESKFNSGLRKWKFIMVSCKVDEFIKDLYRSLEDKGKPFLVRWDSRFEIYAMTWDDIFKSFEIRHRYLLDKLQFNKVAIEEELEAKGIEFSKESSYMLTQKILNAQAN